MVARREIHIQMSMDFPLYLLHQLTLFCSKTTLIQ